jgi:pimeloyl-ACP methyl ester carboxylesterase
VATCTLEQMADDLAELCQTLGITAPVVLGHSAGGFVALHLALRHPHAVGGLILCDTAPTLAPLPDDDPPASLADRASGRVCAGRRSPVRRGLFRGSARRVRPTRGPVLRRPGTQRSSRPNHAAEHPRHRCRRPLLFCPVRLLRRAAPPAGNRRPSAGRRRSARLGLPAGGQPRPGFRDPVRAAGARSAMRGTSRSPRNPMLSRQRSVRFSRNWPQPWQHHPSSDPTSYGYTERSAISISRSAALSADRPRPE